MQLGLQCLAWWQHGEVIGNPNVAFVQLEQLDMLVILACTLDQSDRGILAFHLLVLFQVT